MAIMFQSSPPQLRRPINLKLSRGKRFPQSVALEEPDIQPMTPTGTLRGKVQNPTLPPPTIEVIVAFGSTHFTHQDVDDVCLHFAHDFDWSLVSSDECFQTLAHQRDEKAAQKDLGFLHVDALRIKLEKGQRVQSYFAVPVVKRAIDRLVDRGGRRFVVTLANQETAARFAAEVAVPVAVLRFMRTTGEISRALYLKLSTKDKVVTSILCADTVEDTYRSLQAVMFAKGKDEKLVEQRPTPCSE